MVVVVVVVPVELVDMVVVVSKVQLVGRVAVDSFAVVAGNTGVEVGWVVGRAVVVVAVVVAPLTSRVCSHG